MPRSKIAKNSSDTKVRLKFFFGALHLLFLILLGRLFYWQIIKSDSLQARAEDQYFRSIIDRPVRGSIYTTDDYLLVGNQTVYRLAADPSVVNQKFSPTNIAEKLTPILIHDVRDFQQASEAAKRDLLKSELQNYLTKQLEQKNKKWVSLKSKISQKTKQKISDLNIEGLLYEPYLTRYYPEASMAAHVTGFVGKDKKGLDKGYFGVEGAMDMELKGKQSEQTWVTDALGLQLWNNQNQNNTIDGRDVVLTIRRDLQATVESLLSKGVEKYGAKSGEVIVMNPQTGAILALAAFPSYDQQLFYEYDNRFYKNPTLTNSFEPGSIFKPLTVAIGIDTDEIDPETECPVCDKPRVIGDYTIRTWNNEYSPNINMTDALAKSDNTAMIFIAEKIGEKRFLDYLEKFEIGKKIEIDLQEDTTTPIREKWGFIHLATASFGQGIVTNSMQMIKAVSSIANQGQMMNPYIVEKVIDHHSGKSLTTKPQLVSKVISSETAQTVTKMMVAAAEHGEAQWTSSSTHTIAGKTGTSQVAGEGGYEEDKTIASFIGFAPANNPKFIMLVKLVEPQSSPWAAETAAPLWYQIAQKIFLLMQIPPDKH